MRVARRFCAAAARGRFTELRRLALAVLFLWPAPPIDAQVEACALDPGPAATLLLPYFEVDLGSTGGVTTLFSVINAASTPVLARVTLWTDLGIASQTFNLTLTGYDVETMNLRDVFEGRLPRTTNPSCDLNLGLTPAQIADLKAEHRGQASVRRGNQCLASNFGDGRARGYVTVDTVDNCSARSPSDADYFGSAGEATSQNVLWGDYFYVDSAENFAQGEALVRIQAFPGRFLAGQRTFYGSLHGGSVADEREPLVLSWASRFVNSAAFTGGTDLIVWQDPGTPRSPFPCSLPNPWPIPATPLVYFDEQENAEFPIFDCPILCPPVNFSPFPLVTNRVPVDGPGLPTPFDFGYIFIGLGADAPRQSWIGTLMSADGRYGVGFASNPLDSACGSPACPSGVCTP